MAHCTTANGILRHAAVTNECLTSHLICVGAGLMGAGITEVSAVKDYKVVLQVRISTVLPRVLAMALPLGGHSKLSMVFIC